MPTVRVNCYKDMPSSLKNLTFQSILILSVDLIISGSGGWNGPTSHRLVKTMRGNHTNNYAEAGMRIIKEIVFGRIKAYNLIQMFQFITVTMVKYFINRLLDMAHSRYRPGIALRADIPQS